MEFLDTSFLQNDEIKLVLDKFYSGNLAINWVPAYSFYICDLKGNKMGKCDLRIGYSEGLYYGGHIGYTIDEKYRGNHYSVNSFLNWQKSMIWNIYISPQILITTLQIRYVNI